MQEYSRNTGQRGSARFANREDYGGFTDSINFYQHFVIGEYLPETNEEKEQDIVVESPSHNLVFGGSGAGKTSWLMLNIITRPVSFCVIDLKAELYDATAPFLKAKGFKVIRLDPFLHWENKYKQGRSNYEDTPCAYNPLENLNPNNTDYSDEIAAIAEAIIPSNPHESPHWVIAARSMLEGLIAHVIEKSNENATLGRVREIFCEGLSAIIALAEDAVKDEKNIYSANSLAKKKLMKFNGLTADNKELASVYSTADTHLKFLDSPAINRALSRSDFDFRTLLNQNQKIAVFITLPPKRIETHSKFLRLMVSEIINTFSSNGGNSQYPVDLYIDEAATVGYLSSLPMAYSYTRGEGLRLTCIYQSINQLETHYSKEAEVFLDNSSSIIILKVSSLNSAEYFSKLLGSTTIADQFGQEKPQHIGSFSYILDHKLQNTNSPQSFSGHTGTTYSRPLMTSDELRLLPNDLGIVITNGRPAIFRKINVHTEQPYCNALRQNPFHN